MGEEENPKHKNDKTNPFPHKAMRCNRLNRVLRSYLLTVSRSEGGTIFTVSGIGGGVPNHFT